MLNTASQSPLINRRQLLMALSAFASPIKGLANTSNVKTDQLISAININTSASAGTDARLKKSGIFLMGQYSPEPISTGFRGHEVIVDVSRPDHYVFFPRRPGTRGLIINSQNKSVALHFDAKSNHHFLGHGFIDGQTNRLFTSEANFVTGEGKIGIRELGSLKQIGEWSSGGVGPHQIKLMPDKTTIVIANGGLRTHPNSGRDVLNLTTMASNLTYINKNTGAPVGQFTVFEPKASIRHLDVCDDYIAVAMQVQRSACNHQRAVPLLAIQNNVVKNNSTPLVEVSTPASILHKMDDYLGSVAINASAGIVAATSPRGNIVAFWSLETRQFLHYHSFFDVCGLAVSTNKKYFVLTNSKGAVRYINAHTLQNDQALRRQFSGVSFDNHLLIKPNYL